MTLRADTLPDDTTRQKRTLIGRSSLAHRTVLALLGVLALGACSKDASKPAEDAQPVVYCSADEQFAADVFAEFEKRTGIKARVLFDTEAGKTTNLVRKIEAEQDNPRADVFWSSEVFNTVQLTKKGLLEAYRPTTAEDIPKQYRCPRDFWVGFGARGRVLAFNTQKVKKEQLTKSWIDLADKKWASRLAIANPQFGTTRGHVASMFVLWGDDKAVDFLKKLKAANVTIADGNASAVRMVGRGEVDLCMTDTDDVWVAQKNGMPVDLIYPAMVEGQGTLWIPNSVCIIKDCRHLEAAKKVVDFLASADVERMLAKSDSRNVPVRPKLREELGMAPPEGLDVFLPKIGHAMPEAIAKAQEILLR